MNKLPDKEWFRPDEVAKHFGFSKRTVYLWIKTEQIKAKRIMGSLRVHRTVVEKMPKDIYE